MNKMKKIHIVAFGVLIIALSLIFTASKDFSTYASFSDALASGQDVKIVGELAKDKEIYYDPAEDPNYFSFYVTDKEGETRKVVMKRPKPQDFELSEEIVVTGSIQGDEFVGKDILLKCPSKYKDEEIYIREENRS